MKDFILQLFRNSIFDPLVVSLSLVLMKIITQFAVPQRVPYPIIMVMKWRSVNTRYEPKRVWLSCVHVDDGNGKVAKDNRNLCVPLIGTQCVMVKNHILETYWPNPIVAPQCIQQ